MALMSRCCSATGSGTRILVGQMLWALLTVVATTIGLSAAGQGYRVSFVTERTTPAGVVSTIERGTYVVAPDGRYRKEVENAKGEHLGEIQDANQDRLIKLDFEGKQALIGSSAALWPGPSSEGKLRGTIPGPVKGFNGSDEVDLGTKLVQGLSLTGTRTTFRYSRDDQDFAHVFDTWLYVFPTRGVFPIILERRFESPEETIETHVTDVEPVPVQDAEFTIPNDFVVVRLGK